MDPATTTVWLFVLYCVADCGEQTKMQKNDFFNSQSSEGCVLEAKDLIATRGLVGKWEIECKPHQLTVTVRPIQGN